MKPANVILPGATLGVLGGGQLGRMFALAARRMGYRVHVLSPDGDSPTGQVADIETQAAYDDLDAVARFARTVSVVTFEFENIPAAAAETAARFAPVRPAGSLLHTTQNRARERAFLAGAGLPVTPHALVRSPDELRSALDRLGVPAVLKTAAWGYDGKGQLRLDRAEDAPRAWESLRTDQAVLEAFIDFHSELSVIVARGLTGDIATYGPLANLHRNHILDITSIPAAIDPAIARDAVEIARTVAQVSDLVGILCVEYFLGKDGRLMINELAPRPHNSGHLTIDAHVTCQFEQQVRAVCGLPLGSPQLLRPAAMANLLGDLWQSGEPDWSAACAVPGVKLHLYGKRDPRPGRKMGHLTALATTTGEAVKLVKEAREALVREGAACQAEA